ncbi:MAG TPA: LacI family DNA-binding transcriptional regulator [Chloroflexota bacterium]|nr:LacI family DNA-binding transcriptional regulator [Chloroflexota bacterium]
MSEDRSSRSSPQRPRPRRPRPTVRDVADAAGVSAAVASVVLRDGAEGQSNIRAGAATRDRVRRAAERLGYTPNAAARALRTGRTHTIGVAVRQLSHPFFAAIVEGIAAACSAAGYHLLLGDTRSDEREEQEIVTLLSHGRADGLLVLGELPEDEPTITAALKRRTPLVLVARPPLGGAPAVVLDHHRAITLGLDHLRALGHRTIAVALPAESRPMPAGQTRVAETRAYATRHGWPAPLTLDVGDEDAAALGARLGTLKSADRTDSITAVLASDRVAVRVLKAAQAAGLDVPGDLSILALDGTEMTTHTTPSLTSVTQPLREMGREAAERLLARLNGAAPAEGRASSGVVTLEPTLAVRGSTAPPRARRGGRAA